MDSEIFYKGTDMKACRKCKIEKSLDSFGKRSREKDGLDYYCKECVNIQSRKYYHEHSERLKPLMTAWRKENLSHVKEYKLGRKERDAKLSSDYYKLHPDKGRERARRRRARKLENGAVPYNDIDVFERDDLTCQICKEFVDLNLKRPHPLSSSIDHIIPLVLGGSDTFENVRASHLRCNLSRPKDGSDL